MKLYINYYIITIIFITCCIKNVMTFLLHAVLKMYRLRAKLPRIHCKGLFRVAMINVSWMLMLIWQHRELGGLGHC